jgi:hypothetical protein
LFLSLSTKIHLLDRFITVLLFFLQEFASEALQLVKSFFPDTVVTVVAITSLQQVESSIKEGCWVSFIV